MALRVLDSRSMADRRTLRPPHHRIHPSRIFRQRMRSDSFPGHHTPSNPPVNQQQYWVRPDLEFIDGHMCLNAQSSVSQIPWEEDESENRQPSLPRMEGSNYWYSYDEETIVLELNGDHIPTPAPPNDGFPEESISDHIQTRTHHAASANQESDLCVVCQSEYENMEILGRLRCGHEYHADCITRWLLLRKFCPICKRTA